MKKLENKLAVISGASSGIGKAIAVQFASEGAALLLIARNGAKLDKLKQELSATYGAEIIAMRCDVRNKSHVEALLDKLPEAWRAPDILVNNAGMARGMDTIQNGSTDDWDEMFDTNVKGLLYLTRKFVGGMIERGTGHIINIGSAAGHDVYPKGAVYCATKFAVKALSQGFRLDLLEKGIRVTSVDPGLVETNFSLVRFSGDAERAAQVYKGIRALTADDVADSVLFAATRPPHVNINEIILTPLKQANTNFIIKNQQ
jgi:NADP-dependent 3-hydroxy acid dehydrogenase YdfG